MVSDFDLKPSGLEDLLKKNKPALKSDAAVESNNLNEEINSLTENVQFLLDRNHTVDKEIKTLKSNFESAAMGLTNQIQQINVSSLSVGFS